MQQPLPQPLNRAQRRRMRRTTAVAGAGLALTTSLVGLYPGGHRVPKAYAGASVAPTTGNCNVDTWEELRAAVDTLNDWSQDVSPTLDVICSTITFTGDISDVGVPQSTYANGYAGLLNVIHVPDGESVTIVGQGNTLDFSGDHGTGLLVLAEGNSTGDTSFVIQDLEISGTPYTPASLNYTSPTISTRGALELAIEDSWIHGNTSPTAPAVLVSGDSSASTSVSILRSEFSDNAQGALSASYFDAEGTFAPYGPDVTVTASYFHDNTADFSYASWAGALTVVGTLTVSDSTFTDNTSTVAGGAIDVESPSTSTVTITNSTFRDNSGEGAGSVYVHVADPNDEFVYPDVVSDELAIDHSTFLGGSATRSGVSPYLRAEEVAFRSPYVDASMALTNSVFWGDDASLSDLYWYGSYVSADGIEATASISHSVVGSLGGQTVADQTSNIAAADFDPADLTFGDHGGTILPSSAFDGITITGAMAPAGITAEQHIPTYLPADGSPLIDAAVPGGPELDQRLAPRPSPDGGLPDIGSVEVQSDGGGGGGGGVPPKQSQTVTWNPPTNLWDFDSPVRLPRAVSSGPGAVTYRVLVADTAGCSLGGRHGRRLRFERSGTCSVQAIAAATGRYRAGSATRVFTVKRSRVPSEVRRVRIVSSDPVTGTATLRWRRPADHGTHPITEYRIRVRDVRDENFRTVKTVGVSPRRATITGLEPGTYFVRVRAVNAPGAGVGGDAGPIRVTG